MTKKHFTRSLAICCLSGFCFASGFAKALDLTPTAGLLQGNEGAPTPVVQFSGEKGRIDFQPPHGWQPSGGGNSVSFIAADVKQAWMKLVAVEKKEGLPSGGAAIPAEDLQAWATKFIPAGAEKLELVKIVPSPFTVESRPSTEFIFTFVFFGVRNSMSVSVVDLNMKERLAMLVSSDAGNFERIRQQAISSMFSWSSER